MLVCLPCTLQGDASKKWLGAEDAETVVLIPVGLPCHERGRLLKKWVTNLMCRRRYYTQFPYCENQIYAQINRKWYIICHPFIYWYTRRYCSSSRKISLSSQLQKTWTFFTAIRGRKPLLQPPIYTVSSPQTLPKHLVPFTILYQLVVVLLCAKKPTADGGRKGDDDRLIGPGFVLNQYTYVRIYKPV